MKKAGIYGLRNRVNGKWYIGQSVDPKRRGRVHLTDLERRRHFNPRLQAEFNRHGPVAFVFCVIEHVPVSRLNARERHWIRHHKSTDRNHGYNLEQGGRDITTISVETRAKIGAAHRGRRLSAEHRRKIGQANIGKHTKGHPSTPETNRKISLALTGRKRPEFPAEMRANMSAAHLGKRFTKLHRKRIALALKGRRPSWESRIKMSVAQQLRFFRERKLKAAA